jgi:hypothetical protein
MKKPLPAWLTLFPGGCSKKAQNFALLSAEQANKIEPKEPSVPVISLPAEQCCTESAEVRSEKGEET